MIFKVYYQETKTRNPKREQTQSLYVSANDEVTARDYVEKNIPYNIEYVNLLDEKHLAYEQEHVADFHIMEITS